MTVCSSCGQYQYTSRYARTFVECNCLYWLIDLPISHCWYEVVQKYQCTNCCQNLFTELSLTYYSHVPALNIWNVLFAFQCFSAMHEHPLPCTKLQMRLSGWRFAAWIPSAYFKWYHTSPSPAGLQHAPYQPHSRWLLHFQQEIVRHNISHDCLMSCLTPINLLFYNSNPFSHLHINFLCCKDFMNPSSGNRWDSFSNWLSTLDFGEFNI